MDRERIGKYRILGEIGRGTMGEVYKAFDAVLKRHVALKTLSSRIGPDDEALQRFQREAQAAALLNHPNIVTVHDYGQESGILYMAMELLEGPDLRDAIDNDQMGTLEQQLDIMEGILSGLDDMPRCVEIGVAPAQGDHIVHGGGHFHHLVAKLRPAVGHFFLGTHRSPPTLCGSACRKRRIARSSSEKLGHRERRM